MTRGWWVVLVPVLVGSMGCSKLLRKLTGGDDTPDPATATAPSAATNAADVTHYDDETASTGAETLARKVTARKATNGDVVAKLDTGTDVTKVSEHGGYLLVSFADPDNASNKLMGWVPKDAFTEEATPAATHAALEAPTCKPGQKAVLIGGKAECLRACPSDTELCSDNPRSGLQCEQHPQIVGGVAGAKIKVCVQHHPEEAFSDDGKTCPPNMKIESPIEPPVMCNAVKCTSDGDCPNNTVCKASARDGKFCELGKAAPKPSPQAKCRKGKSGRCVPTCTDDKECAPHTCALAGDDFRVCSGDLDEFE